jgi:hypothetical protein
MATVLFAIVGMVVLILLIQSLRQHKSTPAPNKKEYLALYPERVIGGMISCGCGSTNITAKGTPSNFDTFIICMCKSCHKMLYTSSADDKKPLETGAV